GNFGRTGGAFPAGTADTSDPRYFADGLAMDPVTGRLNRAEGFRRIDQAFGGNFFGTVLATGASYSDGASAADVSGPANRHTRGYAPIGQDGRVDGYDIDYVYSQFKNSSVAPDGQVDWTDLNDAVTADLSCDINGDLMINQQDICTIIF